MFIIELAAFYVKKKISDTLIMFVKTDYDGMLGKLSWCGMVHCHWLYSGIIPLLISANEIAHKACGQPPVMWYNFGWFQPHRACVTCCVRDIEANILIHKAIQVRLRGEWLHWNSHKLLIRLQFGAGICAVVFFSQVKQSQLAKSFNLFDLAKSCTSYRESARPSLHSKKTLVCEDGKTYCRCLC